MANPNEQIIPGCKAMSKNGFWNLIAEVNTAFILIVAALAIAFALAFGIGGRDFAGRMLKKLEESVSNRNDPEA